MTFRRGVKLDPSQVSDRRGRGFRGIIRRRSMLGRPERPFTPRQTRKARLSLGIRNSRRFTKR